MEVIKIKHPYHKEQIVQEDIVLILGFFDGVHTAHQKVIKEGVRIAKERNLKAALMTFNRPPKIAYKKFEPQDYHYLTQPEQKYDLIDRLGVDITYEVFFNSEFGDLPPQDFVDQYIIGWNAKVVVAGFDYTYGKPDIASMSDLPKYSRNHFDIIQVGAEKISDELISSTAIREYIKEGKVAEANAMLGYTYETMGYVVHGDARGRELGYPTANVFSHPYTLLPKVGIYAVRLTVAGKQYDGMASVGYNVTFGERHYITVEVNIFEFNEMIYGEDVKVEWVAYLRDEVKFESAEGLIEQLEQDKINTLKILNK